MRKNIFISLFVFLLLNSCNNNMDITSINIKLEKKLIDPFLTFVIGDSTYIFNYQKINNRHLSNVNLENSLGINDSILIGYLTTFQGNDEYLHLFINKKFSIEELKNSTEKISESVGHTESSNYWPDYEPTESEFESIFSKGSKAILKEHYYFTSDEGIALFFNSLDWTSYIPENKVIARDSFQLNSQFEVLGFEYLSKHEIENMNPGNDVDFIPEYLVGDNEYFMLEISFNLELFSKSDEGNTLNIKDGYIKAIIYK